MWFRCTTPPGISPFDRFSSRGALSADSSLIPIAFRALLRAVLYDLRCQASGSRNGFNMNDDAMEKGEEQAARTGRSDVPGAGVALVHKRPSCCWSTSWNRCGSCGSTKPSPFADGQTSSVSSRRDTAAPSRRPGEEPWRRPYGAFRDGARRRRCRRRDAPDTRRAERRHARKTSISTFAPESTPRWRGATGSISTGPA